MSAQITVFLVEDDALTRNRLRDMLATLDGFACIGAAASLADAEHELSACEPDILLTDLKLPDGSAIRLIERYADLRPQLSILVISVFGDEPTVIRAIEAGAHGYILKTDSAQATEVALRQLVAGGSPISAPIARHLIRRLRPRREIAEAGGGDPPSLLSERELEVLTLAAKGYSYQEIAALLCVSPNTIGSYTKRLYGKLAVHSRSEAIFEAMRLGLVHRPR